MSDVLSLNGIVISSMPMGENDRRIVLLTKERGKISAFARGARKSKSPISAATNPFAFGTFQAFEGRNSYTVVNAEVKRYFDGLSKDYDAICLASYFLEIAEYFSGENIDESERLNLIYLSLAALESKTFDSKLIRRIYELRTLKINGEYPNVFSCIKCGKTENMHRYDTSAMGMVCDSCQDDKNSSISISQDLLYVLQFVLSCDMKKLFSFKLKEDLFNEFDNFMRMYWNRNIDHAFKSERFL